MTQFGRLAPPDWAHVAKYPVQLAQVTKPTPVTIGVNWYSDFDTPERRSDGYWICRDKRIRGYVRGGHAIALEAGAPAADYLAWWDYYDQGSEGACVGFSASRMMSLLNRKRYQASWLYHEAQKLDGIPLPHDGTYVRCAASVLRILGHKGSLATVPHLADGISAYRWAVSPDEILAILQNPYATRRGAVPLLNSWGRSYPRRVWMPCEILDRLLREDGEAVLVTDR